jgi:CBS-domain-containing membrane protein
LLERNDLIRALKERGPDAKVGDVMRHEMLTLGHRHCLDEAFRLLQQKSAPAVGIIDAAQRLVGLVTGDGRRNADGAPSNARRLAVSSMAAAGWSLTGGISETINDLRI